MGKKAERIAILLFAAFMALAASLLPASPSQASETACARLEKAAPHGFFLSRPPQLYGTAERKLKDGSIFDYMDGGGVAYLEHGFVELFHAEYADGRGGEVTLDAFAMGSAAGAREALADERICPAGGSPLAFDREGRAYRFPPDYFLYMAIGDRLVYLHVNDDRQSGILDRFAVEVRSIVRKEDP